MWFLAFIFTAILAVFSHGSIVAAESSTSGTDLLFSQACIAWKLVSSRAIGNGWAFSAFCKDDYGVYSWDEHNYLDNCVGVNENGRLVHELSGRMSLQCAECNNNEDWGHTTSIDHSLVCNCTNAKGETVTSSLNLDTAFGYAKNMVYCLDTPAHPRNQARDADLYGIARNLPRPVIHDLTPRVDHAAQDHCCFYDSCSHDMAMRQPEPWLYTRCRKIGEPEPSHFSRLDVNQVFMYDRSDWTIKPGEGFYDTANLCRDCHTGGSWMYCQCIKADGNFTETSIDLNLHVSNINGRLCSSSYCGDNEGPTAPIDGVW